MTTTTARRSSDDRGSPEGRRSADGQRSLDDLGTPLHDVTFVVVDLETTGGAPGSDAITEIGAVKYRGGHRLGTFQTLVNPGSAVPPAITLVTGITTAMVVRAPRIGEVLPTFLEFCGDAVLVGHNVRFDTGFLDRALVASDRPRLHHRVVDTLALARRLLSDEVPNCRLATLASRLRLPNRPCHRALDDALATADLLHLLLERAAGIGVLGLDDLISLPTIAGHPQAPKLGLTASLPREPGVYMFRDRDGRLLYIGKAANLRARVRSYFSSDRRRKVAQLLRETHRIDHLVCPGPLEPEVTELRFIAQHRPRFNRQATDPGRYVYLKLSLGERFPRLSVARSVPDDGSLYLGPVASSRQARMAIEAVEQASQVRRCTLRSSRSRLGRDAPCAAAQLGVSACPCSGSTGDAEYAAVVAELHRALTTEPRLLLGPLHDRMTRLAAEERFEEAADVRDRAAALMAVLRRQQRIDRLRRAGRIRLVTATGGEVEIDGGRLVASRPADRPPSLTGMSQLPPPPPASAPGRPLDRLAVDELMAIGRWIDANGGGLRVEEVEGELSDTAVPLPRFEPARRPRREAWDGP